MRVLSTIAEISKAVDTENPDLVYQALANPGCHVSVGLLSYKYIFNKKLFLYIYVYISYLGIRSRE